MTSDEILDGLQEASDAILTAGSDHRSVWLAEGGQFSLTRLGSPSGNRWYVASLNIQTASGLVIPLERRFHDGEGHLAFDRNDLIASVLRTMDAIAAGDTIDEAFEDLCTAIEEAYASARQEGIALRTASLVARPLRIGDEPEVRFELTSMMLDADLEQRSFVMRVADAADFRTCFADEIMPEQRARSARRRGLNVPEAIND